MADSGASDYRRIVETVAADIQAGELRPGEQLPPQREFADRHRIAVSTASRVYAELVRRGLVVGEVGRGTFVRAATAAPGMLLTDPRADRIDLEINVPVLPEQARRLSQSLAPLLRRSAAFGATLYPVAPNGTADARKMAAAFLSRGGWSALPESLFFTGNGKQAIAAAIAALVKPGERLGVEALSYPVVKHIAARLGVDLVALQLDDKGLTPGAILAAHHRAPLRAIYCQPVLHNPLGMTMPRPRKAEIARVLEQHDIVAIEDCVYGFLAGPAAPMAALAPDHTVVVDSLSKRVAPGLSVGFIVAPERSRAGVAASIRSGAWHASGFALEAAILWMADGTVSAISAAKIRDAALRQQVAKRVLSGFEVRTDPRAYHCWLALPEPWRAETFVTAAAQRGIGIAPAAAFAMSPGHAPNAVRLALASPTVQTLETALRTLVELLELEPSSWNLE